MICSALLKFVRRLQCWLGILEEYLLWLLLNLFILLYISVIYLSPYVVARRTVGES